MAALVVDILSKFNAKGFNAAAKSITKFDRQLYKVQRATMAFSTVVAGVGIVAGKMAMTFDDSMGKIVSLVGIGRDEVNAWKKDILKLAPALGKSPKALADAMFFITSAGLRGETALKALEAAAKASAAGLGEIKEISKAVTAAINVYGKAAMSASNATDILTATVRLGSIEAAELSPVLGKLLLPAKTLGISFNEVGGAMAALSRKGFNAAEAATALRGVFMTLNKAMPKGDKELQKVGLSFEKLKKILKEEGLLKFLQVLDDKFKNNTNALSKVIPRAEALTAILGLTGSNIQVTTELLTDMNDVLGENDRAFTKASEESMFKFNQALALIKVTAITLGNEILPILIPLLVKLTDKIKEMVDYFSELEPLTKSLMVKSLILLATLGPILLILSKIVGMVTVLLPMVKFIALTALPLAIIKGSAFVGVLSTAVQMVGGLKLLALTITGIGLAFGPLAIAGWMWYKDWDKLMKDSRTIINWFSDEAKKISKNLFNALGDDIQKFITKHKSKLEAILNLSIRVATLGAVGLDTFYKPEKPAPGPFVGPLAPGPGTGGADKIEPGSTGSPFNIQAEGDFFEEEAVTMADQWNEAIENMNAATVTFGDVFNMAVSGSMAGATDSVNQFFTSFREGSIQIGTLFKGVMESIFNTFMQMVAQMIAKWLILMVLTGGKAKFGMQLLGSFAKGGAVEKTGAHMLHAGEFVLPPGVVDSIKKGTPPKPGMMSPQLAGASGANVNITQHIEIGAGSDKNNINDIMEKITQATKNGVRQAQELANVQTKAGNKKASEGI